MTKREFIDALNARATTLPQAERERLAAYYNEIIDDSMEEGVPEEEAVAALGDVDALLRELAPAAEAQRFTGNAEHMDSLREIRLRVQDADVFVVRAPLDNGAAVQFRVSDPNLFRWQAQDGVLEIIELRSPRGNLFRTRQQRVSVTVADDNLQQLSVESRSGDVSLEGLLVAGQIALSISSGDVKMAGVACGGSLALDSRSGDVEIDRCAFRGDARVATASGDVDVRGADAAGELRVECASGDIELRDARADTLVCRSVSGDVEIDRAQAGVLAVASTSGDAELTEASGAGRLSVETTSGDIDLDRCDYPEIALAATSGNIVAQMPNLPGGLNLNANSRVGRIRLPRTWTPPQGEGVRRSLNARTVSGNITVAVIE